MLNEWQKYPGVFLVSILTQSVYVQYYSYRKFRVLKFKWPAERGYSLCLENGCVGVPGALFLQECSLAHHRVLLARIPRTITLNYYTTACQPNKWLCLNSERSRRTGVKSQSTQSIPLLCLSALVWRGSFWNLWLGLATYIFFFWKMAIATKQGQFKNRHQGSITSFWKNGCAVVKKTIVGFLLHGSLVFWRELVFGWWWWWSWLRRADGQGGSSGYQPTSCLGD